MLYVLKILGLSSDGLLGYEAPRSGAFRKFFGPGGTLFGRRDIPVSRLGDTPPQTCFGGEGRKSISARTCKQRGEERRRNCQKSAPQSDWHGHGAVTPAAAGRLLENCGHFLFLTKDQLF